VKFVIFAILVISMATFAGLLKSGRISLNRYFSTSTAAVQAPAHATAAIHAATPPPVPAPAAGTFVVTSISIGQPSFAIINGTSRVAGDPVEAPGATGWTVKQIVDGAVILQNGSTLTTIPLSTPGIKPLDDDLHPLN
jgi:hypothetical protein